jgi:hypothetical protein
LERTLARYCCTNFVLISSLAPEKVILGEYLKTWDIYLDCIEKQICPPENWMNCFKKLLSLSKNLKENDEEFSKLTAEGIFAESNGKLKGKLPSNMNLYISGI